MDLVHLRMLEARGLLLQALELGAAIACDHQASLTERMDASLICASCAVRHGDYRLGLQFAMQAEALAAEAGSPQGIALARSFAGSACVLSGQAAVEFESQGMTARAIAAHQDAAWLLLREGCATDAADHLCMARWLEDDADPEQRARQQALEAYHFHLLGQQNQAIRHVDTILTSDHGDAFPWPRALAAYLATAVALESGRPDIAGAMLNVALAHVRQTQDPNLMNMVGELRGALKA